MAPRTQTEQSEREFQSEINAAIAGTEDEIFREAMDASLDDNDGDHELEDMGEGLEGDHIDEDIETEDPEEPRAEDDEEAADDPDADEADDEDDDQVDDEGDEDDVQARDDRGRFERAEPRVPPGRLREVNERARQAEQREQQLRSELATVNARLNDVVTRLNAPPQQQPTQQQAPPPKPDVFVDPDGYERWVLQEAERRADERLQARLQERDQQQQAMANQRVDHAFNRAIQSNRGFEFQPAFRALTSLDPRDPQARATVQSIYNAQDPAAALFEWWDDNGGAEFREQIAEQLGFQPRQQRREARMRNEPRAPRREQPQQAPRYEYRGPKPMRSLNSASGSNAHRNVDSREFDGSDGSIFEYATQK